MVEDLQARQFYRADDKEAEENEEDFYRGSRACLVCGLVKSTFEFIAEGCTNCDMLLLMRGDQESVYAHTTDLFDCTFVLMIPENGWATGLYAMLVVGELPIFTLVLLNLLGIWYRAVSPLDVELFESSDEEFYPGDF